MTMNAVCSTQYAPLLLIVPLYEYAFCFIVDSFPRGVSAFRTARPWPRVVKATTDDHTAFHSAARKVTTSFVVCLHSVNWKEDMRIWKEAIFV
jgi:hypothetical protein